MQISHFLVIDLQRNIRWCANIIPKHMSRDRFSCGLIDRKSQHQVVCRRILHEQEGTRWTVPRLPWVTRHYRGSTQWPTAGWTTTHWHRWQPALCCHHSLPCSTDRWYSRRQYRTLQTVTCRSLRKCKRCLGVTMLVAACNDMWLCDMVIVPEQVTTYRVYNTLFYEFNTITSISLTMLKQYMPAS